VSFGAEDKSLRSGIALSPDSGTAAKWKKLKTEMAELVKRLADLRRESREQEGSANQYKLYEVEPNENKSQHRNNS